MITFDLWYRLNRIKHMAKSLKELHQLYDEEISWVYGLVSAIDIKVFVYLLKLADIKGEVNLTPTLRKGLANLIDISMQQITNSLKTLKDKELIKGGRRKYTILL